MTDTERLDWLEEQFGWGLLSDDNGHFACVFEGFQTLPEGPDPIDLDTSFYVEKECWRPTVREAIDAAMEARE